VERILGRRVFDTGQATDLSVSVHIAWDARSELWSAHILLAGTDGETLGERTVTKGGSRCEGLEVSLAVVLALILDMPRGPAAESSPEPTTIHLPDDVYDSGWGFRGSAGAEGVLGLLPEVAVGLSPSLTLAPPGFWPIRMGMAVLMTREHQVQGARTSFGAYWGGLALCPALAEGAALALDLCAGASMGVVTGAGLDLRTSRTVRRLHAQIDLGASLRIFLGGPFEIVVEAGAAAPLVRHTYTITLVEQVYEVHRPWPVVGVARVALGVGFGG